MDHLNIKILLCLIILTATGCFNSENEYERLVERNNDLAEELAAAKDENLWLSQSLVNVTQERDRLQALLDTEKSRLTANARPLSGTEDAQTSAGASGDDELWVEGAIGQETPTPPAASEQPPARASSGRVYVVKPGDVLYYIASRNNTTVEAILELNPQLRSRPNYMIHVNERLQLP